jgi:hypothetical protein
MRAGSRRGGTCGFTTGEGKRLENFLAFTNESRGVLRSCLTALLLLTFAMSPVAFAQTGTEVFPPNCQPPPGWTFSPNAPASTFVSSAAGVSSEGICAVYLRRFFALPPEPVPDTRTEFTGVFNGGNITFSRKVQSNNDCFRFSIDGLDLPVGGTGGSCLSGADGASGNLPHTVISIPVNAGAHTVSWTMTSFFGGEASAVAWIDEVRMPLSIAITSGADVSSTVGTSLSYATTATNFPASFTATGLPPGISIDSVTGLIAGVPTTAGIYAVTITASNPGGANPDASATKAVSFVIVKTAQTISFLPIGNQLPSAPPFTVAATGGASDNPVTFTASGVCTSSGTNGERITLSGLSGDCTINADQAGDDVFDAAERVTRVVHIDDVPPDAPQIISALPGDGGVTIAFIPSAHNGGSAILDYFAKCISAPNVGIFRFGTESPITISPLTNDTLYSCSVSVKNAAGFASESGIVQVTPKAIAFTGNAFSRKVHGNGVGVKDLPLTITDINGAFTVEPRSSGRTHQILFLFDTTVNSINGALVSDTSMASVGNVIPSFNGNEVILSLSEIPDSTRLTISIFGVNGGPTNVSTAIGFLVGDINSNRAVNAADISAVKSRRGTAVGNANFQLDVTLDGKIGNEDVSAIKARSGQTIP